MPSALSAVSCVLLSAACLVACGSSDSSGSTGAGSQAPAVGTLEEFATLPGTSEGLAMSVDAAGEPALYVGSAQKLLRVSPEGDVAEVADVPSPLGVARTATDDLLVCGKAEGADAPGVVWRVTPSGERSVLVASDASPYGVVNFLAIAPDGSLAFSDSKADKVYRADADGSNAALVTDAVSYPNGVAFSADGSALYVASWDSKKIYAIPRDAGGGYGAPEVFADDVENVDGITVLASGDLLLVQSGDGVVRRAKDGTKEVLAPGVSLGLPANGAFGAGPYGEEWLYVTNLLGKTLWRVYVGEPGVSLPVR